MAKEIVNSSKAPAPIGPYNQAVIANGFLFTSGQIALDPASQSLIEGGIREPTRQVLANLGAILDQAGSSFAKVVKTTVYLKNMSDFPDMNAVYGEHFPNPAPARSTVEVARLPKDVLVEIDCIALL